MPNKEYPFHQISKIFPLMQGKEFDEFKADIRENGQREPIWLSNGEIIDGRNRYLACIDLDIEPTYREWDGQGTLMDLVISLNLKRRYLDESQRSMAAARALPFYEEAAKERQKSAGENFGRGKDSANLHGPIEASRKSSEDAAKPFNVSARSVANADTVINKGTPELVRAVDAGKIAVSTAATIAKVPAERQHEIVKLDDPKAIVQAAKEIRAAEKPLPTRKTDGDIATPSTNKEGAQTQEVESVDGLKLLLENAVQRLDELSTDFAPFQTSAADPNSWYHQVPDLDQNLRNMVTKFDELKRMMKDTGTKLEGVVEEVDLETSVEPSMPAPKDGCEINLTSAETNSDQQLQLVESIAGKMGRDVPADNQGRVDLLKEMADLHNVPREWKKFSIEEKKLSKQVLKTGQLPCLPKEGPPVVIV